MNFGQWISLIALSISLYILWQARQLLLLVFTAVVLATALNLLVCQFQRLQLKRHEAVFLGLGALIILLLGFFWLIVPVFKVKIATTSSQ